MQFSLFLKTEVILFSFTVIKITSLISYQNDFIENTQNTFSFETVKKSPSDSHLFKILCR